MAMLKNKHITLALISVCLIVVSPMAKAQLLGALGALAGSVINIPTITGALFCSANGTLGAPLNSTAASALAFANAGLQLRCGNQSTVVSTTTTNANGLFSFPTGGIQMLLSSLLSNCRIVVTTPLSNCNSTLPAVGNLVSQLSVVGNSTTGLLNIINIVPTLFNLLI